MSDVETLKAELKKLSSRATTMKMNLHDLSEDLPTGWENILTVAQECFDAHKALTEARAKLKKLESA